jgi:integrase
MRCLRWDNIEDGVLRVTGTKAGTDLVLPITPMMESVLAEMYGMHGDKSEFVFPATTSYRKPIPQGSLHHLLMTHADGWHCHTLRHTVKSHLAELKVPLESRAAILNHRLPGVGENVYNHSEMMEFKRDGMLVWHEKLENLLRPQLKIAVKA